MWYCQCHFSGPMRLLASTDFALRILMALGQCAAGETVNVGMLAQSLGGLSRNHLHKIAQDLAALGIVKTIRGAGGGVKLAKAPRAVRIGALVRALESDQPLVECFRADHGCCTLDPGCRLRPMLKRARERFHETLDEYTLADRLAGPRNSKYPPAKPGALRLGPLKGAQLPTSNL